MNNFKFLRLAILLFSLSIVGCEGYSPSSLQGSWRQNYFEHLGKIQTELASEYHLHVQDDKFTLYSTYDNYSVIEYFRNEHPIRYRRTHKLQNGTIFSSQGIVSVTQTEMIECYSSRDDTLPRSFESQPGSFAVIDTWQRQPSAEVLDNDPFQGDWILKRREFNGIVEPSNTRQGSRMKIMDDFCHSRIVTNSSGKLNFVGDNKFLMIDKFTNNKTYVLWGIINGKLELCCDSTGSFFPNAFLTTSNDYYYLRNMSHF